MIGGGYVAVELAGMLNALGSRVTLVALEDRLLERFDPMVSEVLEQAIARARAGSSRNSSRAWASISACRANNSSSMGLQVPSRIPTIS